MTKKLGTALKNNVMERRTQGVRFDRCKQDSLKEDAIIKLQTFYRISVKYNVSDTNCMKQSIVVTMYHCMLTDKNMLHSNCLKGAQSFFLTKELMHPVKHL